MTTNDLDESLFSALHDNGRLSLSALSRRVGASRHRVQDRLLELLENESICIVANVHPALLGINAYCHLLIRIEGISAPVTAALDALPEVVLVSLVSGELDVVAEVGVRDADHLSQTISTIRAFPGVRFLEASQHAQIYKSRFSSVRDLGIPPELDSRDSRLVALLQKDGRMSYRDLGVTLGLTAGSARARVQKLISNGSLRITCDVKRSESVRSVLMGIGISVKGEIDSVLSDLLAHDYVEFAASTIGKFDIVATLSATSLRTLGIALDDIRQSPSVGRVSSWVHLDVVRESYE